MRMKPQIILFFLALLWAAPTWAQISFIAKANNSAGSGTALSVTHGLTLVNDDVMIGIVHTDNVSDSITDNNGTEAWTAVFGEDGQSGTHSYQIFRRIIDGNEGTTFDFTSNGNLRWTLAVFQWRGVDTADIFDVTPSATTSNNGGSDQTIIGNDITVAAGTVGIFIAMPDSVNRFFSAITDSYIARLESTTNPGQDTAIYSKAYPSGQATTTIEATYSLTTNWDTQHFSLKGTAFPTVQAVNGGTQATSTTSHTVNLPAGIQNGNLLFAVITVTGLPASGLATQITWPTGWAELYERIYDDAIDVGTQSLAFRRADGTEGGSITVTTDDSVFSSHTSYRLTGHHATSDPEVGSAAAGNTNPNPPSLSPSWGAENTLWFALCGFSLNDDDITISSAPTNYTNLREDNGGATGEQTSTGTARRELNSASENPGIFTITTGRRWVANTIAIRPAAAVTVTPRRRVVVY